MFSLVSRKFLAMRNIALYSVDETNSRLDYSLACNKFSNHKFIINKHVLVSWGLLRNKLQFCLLIRNETSIKKNFHIKCNKMTHRQKITTNNGILFLKLFWPIVRIFFEISRKIHSNREQNYFQSFPGGFSDLIH